MTLKIHTHFLSKIETNLFYCCEKVYCYEYMDIWENFNETSLPEKEDFYSHLNMEHITDTDHTHPKRVKILK